jgi:hypothetical protein
MIDGRWDQHVQRSHGAEYVADAGQHDDCAGLAQNVAGTPGRSRTGEM